MRSTMVHNKAPRLNGVSQGKKQPVCAVPDSVIEVCVQESVFRKYRRGPLDHLQKILLETDLRLAVGVAVTVLAAWRFFQCRKRKEEFVNQELHSKVANEELCDEEGVVAELEQIDTTWEGSSQEAALVMNLENEEGCLWSKDGLRESDVMQDHANLSENHNGIESAPANKESGSQFADKGHGVNMLDERTHVLKMDLEESEANRRAAQEGLLARGYGRSDVAEAGSPVSSTSGTPLETASPTSGDSPVAALLAKAKATSEKVDRIHERLRRLSKGDGPK